MKTLPDAIIAGMDGDSDRVILVRIIPESGDTWAEFDWATKDITVLDWEGDGSSKSFAGNMLAKDRLGTIRQSVDIEEGGNVATVSNLTVSIRNAQYNGEDRFDQTLTGDLENRRVEIRRVFWTGSSPAWSDTLLLYEGVVEDVDYDFKIYKIKVRDAGFKRHKDVPDLVLNEVDYPNVPDNNKGAVVPLLYGACATGLYQTHNLHRVPMLQYDKNKLKYLVSRNASSDGDTFAYVHTYHEDANRYPQIFPVSGSLTFTSGRPSTLTFPLGVRSRARIYSQAEEQGSQTDPSDLDFSNAVDNDLGTGVTLTQGQKLLLRVPLPKGFITAPLFRQGDLKFEVKFGSISGAAAPTKIGKIYYYNPEFDDGVGGSSTGEEFDADDADLNIDRYQFALDNSAHGVEDDQSDANLRWNIDEMQYYEFGVEIYDTPGYQAEVKNMYMLLNNLPVLTFALFSPPQFRSKSLREIFKTRIEHWKQERQQLYIYVNGQRFGAWIDADSRDNGYNQNHLVHYGAYIIECLLRSELGLTSSEIDYDAFDIMGNNSDGDRKDWVFDTIVDEQENSLGTIRRFCREGAIVYYQDYQNKESVFALKKKTAVKTVDRTTIQEDTIKVRLSELTNVYNEFYVHYVKDARGNYTKLRYLTASAQNLTSNTRGGTPNTYTGLCSDSQSKYQITKRLEIKCDWIRDDTTANTLLLWLAEWLCYRKRIFPFKTRGQDHINLELGDQIKIDHTLLPAGVSDDASFVIFDIKDDLDNDRMKFECMQVPDLLP